MYTPRKLSWPDHDIIFVGGPDGITFGDQAPLGLGNVARILGAESHANEAPAPTAWAGIRAAQWADALAHPESA